MEVWQTSKYKDFIKLKLVEKKTTRNKQKIIFKAKSNLVVKIFDLKWKIPKIQNNIRFMFVIKFPKKKLIGKKANVRFVNKVKFILKLFLFKIITTLWEP